jgi:hypothetical protein
MSKRFPVPEFDRFRYKNLAWSAPALLDNVTVQSKRRGAGAERAPSAVAVALDDEFCARFRLRGPHRHVVMCVTPACDISLVGRSYAWPIQRALIVSSLDADRTTVLADWTTPRAMNTRLGPEHGIVVSGGEFYIVCAHGNGDHWIFNRTLIESALDATGRSELRVASATGEDNNDFHACNVTATWQG